MKEGESKKRWETEDDVNEKERVMIKKKLRQEDELIK
jgi:hypothetical protein